MEVQPFKIEISDEVLADLRRRLEKTRWPDETRFPAPAGTTVATWTTSKS